MGELHLYIVSKNPDIVWKIDWVTLFGIVAIKTVTDPKPLKDLKNKY